MSSQSPLAFKICFKGTIIKLGTDVLTFQQLVTKIKERFPEIKHFSLVSKECQITQNNFNTFLSQAVKNDEKSVKIQVNDHLVFQKQQKGQTLQKITGNQDIREEFGRKSKKYEFNLHQEEEENQNEPQAEKLLASQKQQTNSEQDECDKIKIKLFIENNKSNIKVEEETEYFWTCIIINESSLPLSNNLKIKDLNTKKLLEVNGLKGNQCRTLNLGPFYQKELGKHDHMYQLVYEKNQTIRNIGFRFGFVCDVSKRIKVKQIQNKLHRRISYLRDFFECRSSAENLIMKLKEVGIGESQIDLYDDQTLIEMLQSLNVNW